VEDDADARNAVQMILETAGFTVETASCAQEAMAQLPGRSYDLAILDLMMEENDSGVQVAQALRRSAGGRRLPIILLTAVTEKTGFRVPLETEEEREWLQVEAWLDKPVTPQRLLAEVARLQGE
jgi:CheY-like chemotaxis protein